VARETWVIARKKLDIGWSDLGFALACCLGPGQRMRRQRRLEAACAGDRAALVALSVRSGFDGLLQALALPPGSEVVLSAVTIRDMVTIIESHGLRPVPVDVDMQRLAVDAGDIERVLTPRTRAILLAHLFGSRMPLEPLVEVARRHGLLLIEDCAQAFTADGDLGHPGCDVSMLSFGPIKTATALGGALLRFRDPGLCDSVHRGQQQFAVQSRWSFLKRVAKFGALKLLTMAVPYTAFVRACHWSGASHDAIVNNVARGFPGGELLARLRLQPCGPQVALLARRFARYRRERIARRIAAAESVIAHMPTIRRPGGLAQGHSHWVFPVLSADPDRLVARLWDAGFDATRGASTMCAIGSAEGAAPAQAQQAMRQLVYLPVDDALGKHELARLARCVVEIEGAAVAAG
jgi:dTDP-4-amino-4,6-dideoxygalactose transaminase